MEDTKKELERLQKALLADETMIGEDLTEDLPDDLTEGMDDAAAAQLIEELSQEAEETTAEAPAETEETMEHTLVVDDAMLEELMAEVNGPAFDDSEATAASDETMVFHNFSNDYGKDLAEYGEAEPESEADEETKKRNDKIVIGLMIAACALCVGILGLLIYWLVTFL